MVKKVTIIAMTMVVLVSFSSTASAALISWTDVGVVGGIHGKLKNSNEATEKEAMEWLLGMALSTTDANGPATGFVSCTITGDLGCYMRGATPYNATNIGVGEKGGDGEYTVKAGYQFALAKYGGQQGGSYVLFYIGGNAVVLPEYSYPLWGDNEAQYRIAHYTGFNADVVPGPTPYGAVPDGGSTLLMLGAALIGFGFVRRRIKA